MKLNRTIFRATEILKLLAGEPEGMTLSEIGVELDLPKTSTFDIVQTLRQTHFLRETNKRFHIGFMAREIGETYAEEKEVYGLAKHHLIALVDELNMAGSLVFYQKERLDYILEHVPAGSIIAPAASNGPDFIHASASGKILIAFMTQAKQKKALASLKFIPLTDNTILDLDSFKIELENVREQGYAVDDREFNELMTCVSAPIINRQKVVAAITLSGLQISPETVTTIANKLIAVAHTISVKLTQN